MDTSNSPIKVLYIGGDGRSGSTLLGKILGEIPGFFHVGELTHICAHGLSRNYLCGCGLHFYDCPFWMAVLDDAFGGADKIDVELIKKHKRRVERIRRVPRYILPLLRSAEYRQIEVDYSTSLQQLYRSIQKISGCNVIVDGSKLFTYGLILSQVPGIEMHLLHLTRDSRGVAFSKQRKKKRPEIAGQTVYMPVRSHLRSTLEWDLRNLVTEMVLQRSSISYHQLNYEQFVSDASSSVAKIITRFGKNASGIEFLNNDTFVLSATDHSIGGNPLKFRNGPIKLKLRLYID